MKHTNLINRALDSIPQQQRWQLVALLTNKHPVAIATNDPMKTHPYVNSFNTLKRLHAEIRCIKKAPKSKLKNGILYVIRRSGKGDFRLAKPCTMCLDFIGEAGIKKVIYSTNNIDEFEVISV